MHALILQRTPLCRPCFSLIEGLTALVIIGLIAAIVV